MRVRKLPVLGGVLVLGALAWYTNSHVGKLPTHDQPHHPVAPVRPGGAAAPPLPTPGPTPRPTPRPTPEPTPPPTEAERRVAFAVFLTDVGNPRYMDQLAVLAYSVKEVGRRSKYRCESVSLKINNNYI